jgi:hypothetical protein
MTAAKRRKPRPSASYQRAGHLLRDSKGVARYFADTEEEAVMAYAAINGKSVFRNDPAPLKRKMTDAAMTESLDLTDLPSAPVIQVDDIDAAVRAQGSDPVRTIDTIGSPEKTIADLPPIPADADLRQIPEMPIDVAKVIALAKEVPAQAFCAAMVLRCQAWHQLARRKPPQRQYSARRHGRARPRRLDEHPGAGPRRLPNVFGRTTVQ